VFYRKQVTTFGATSLLALGFATSGGANEISANLTACPTKRYEGKIGGWLAASGS